MPRVLFLAFLFIPTRAFAVDFVRDVQPIFQASCIKCHGAEKKLGQLRLDAKVLALKGGASGAVIVPGKGTESVLYKLLLAADEDERMPRKGPPLPPAQIALVKKWIDEGAVWPDSASVDVKPDVHWAYSKPVRPALPKVSRPGWVHNPIDTFVLARLDEDKLAPASEASKETLIRRATLDLTGLPPTLAEVDAFVADRAQNAYEKVVDRLLASPHYGERWARPWLDLARFADSNGYDEDRIRVMWKYRDWVIRAFNADMPFDRFTVEQIAGDMLPNATVDQRIASGFHADRWMRRPISSAVSSSAKRLCSSDRSSGASFSRQRASAERRPVHSSDSRSCSPKAWSTRSSSSLSNTRRSRPRLRAWCMARLRATPRQNGTKVAGSSGTEAARVTASPNSWNRSSASAPFQTRLRT